MHPNIIGIEDPDEPVYRFEEVHWLLENFRKSQLILRNPAEWDDQWENMMCKIPAMIKSGNVVSLRGIFDRLYGQSWTWRNDDSDDCWRIFSPLRNRVRIKSSPKKLINTIYDKTDILASMSYFVGSVSYIQEDKLKEAIKENADAIVLDNRGYNQSKSLFFKRDLFAHEK